MSKYSNTNTFINIFVSIKFQFDYKEQSEGETNTLKCIFVEIRGSTVYACPHFQAKR